MTDKIIEKMEEISSDKGLCKIIIDDAILHAKNGGCIFWVNYTENVPKYTTIPLYEVEKVNPLKMAIHGLENFLLSYRCEEECFLLVTIQEKINDKNVISGLPFRIPFKDVMHKKTDEDLVNRMKFVD